MSWEDCRIPCNGNGLHCLRNDEQSLFFEQFSDFLNREEKKLTSIDIDDG